MVERTREEISDASPLHNQKAQGQKSFSHSSFLNMVVLTEIVLVITHYTLLVQDGYTTIIK